MIITYYYPPNVAVASAAFIRVSDKNTNNTKSLAQNV